MCKAARSCDVSFFSYSRVVCRKTVVGGCRHNEKGTEERRRSSRMCCAAAVPCVLARTFSYCTAIKDCVRDGGGGVTGNDGGDTLPGGEAEDALDSWELENGRELRNGNDAKKVRE
jgi:hypothetical protein